MEDLSKTQIVLLCLLVSFVTSIGTGIISFSLLDTAPETITQTINRVVERTIETVVSLDKEDDEHGGVAGVTKEVTTIVMSEEDLIVSTIEQNTQSIVRIAAHDSKGNEVFYGLGLVMTKKGGLVAIKNTTDDFISYAALFADGTTYLLSVVKNTQYSDVMLFTIETKEAEDIVFTPVSFGNSDTLKLGQTVISIGGMGHNSVLVGRISGFEYKDVGKNATDVTGESSENGTENSSAENIISSIDTNISLEYAVSGGPLLTISGYVVGLYAASKPNSFIAVGTIVPEVSVFGSN